MVAVATADDRCPDELAAVSALEGLIVLCSRWPLSRLRRPLRPGSGVLPFPLLAPVHGREVVSGQVVRNVVVVIRVPGSQCRVLRARCASNRAWDGEMAEERGVRNTRRRSGGQSWFAWATRLSRVASWPPEHDHDDRQHETPEMYRTAKCGSEDHRRSGSGVWAMVRNDRGSTVDQAESPVTVTDPGRTDGSGVQGWTRLHARPDQRSAGQGSAQGRRLYRREWPARSRIPPVRRACSRYHRRHQTAQAQGSWIAARTAPFPASNEG